MFTVVACLMTTAVVGAWGYLHARKWVKELYDRAEWRRAVDEYNEEIKLSKATMRKS